MPQTFRLQRIFFLFPLVLLAGSCRSNYYFDFRTHEQPATHSATEGEKHQAKDLKATADVSQAIAVRQDMASPNASLTNDIPPPAAPAPFSQNTRFGPVKAEDSSSPEAAALSLSPKEGKRKGKGMRRRLKNREDAFPSFEKGSPAAPTQHPLNRGIPAAILLLAAGIALVFLGALLPTLGTILVSWILGGSVLVIGAIFLVLILMGFDVRIIG
jgi:hypothetical protein